MTKGAMNKTDIVEYKDGKIYKTYSLDKAKNWEIIVDISTPTKSDIERKEINRKKKKKEFQESLKTRNHHKEPPVKKKEKEKNIQHEEIPYEKDSVENITDDMKVLVVKELKEGRSTQTKQKVEDGFKIKKLEQKDIYIHKRHKRDGGSWDYVEHSTPLQDFIKSDLRVDFRPTDHLEKIKSIGYI